MSKTNVVWACSTCGHTQAKWTGACSECKSWNSFVEDVLVKEKNQRFSLKTKVLKKPMRISEIKSSKILRFKTGINEFDRLLGGGIVSGSLSLIGGNPGIGKSTLMLQIANECAEKGLKVLYVSGEESIEQTSLRAKRVFVNSDNLYIFCDTLFSSIKDQIEKLQPDVLIVDSIQILYKAELPSSPGSVSQVRELATEFMHIAKSLGITTFLIGHVTKTGEIAGPRVLEHLVDTVLDFEGDKQHGFRLLRSVKNRFGPCDDIAIFQMKEDGLREVENPSFAFLEERAKEIAGSCIVPTIEGIRSILIEVQSLVTPTSFASPSRRAICLDHNRLSLLLAVLEKRVGYNLHGCDVFVSIAGGIKIVEPAIDLAIILSVASSFSNKTIDGDTVIIGEVGLGGEIRRVSRIENRIKEAINMGFKKCLLPKKNFSEVSKKLASKIKLIGVDLVDDAIFELF